jgi:hypothetical protein
VKKKYKTHKDTPWRVLVVLVCFFVFVFVFGCPLPSRWQG